MTKIEFAQLISRRHRFKKLFEYFLGVTFFVAGLVIIYNIVIVDWQEMPNIGKLLNVLFALLLIGLGLWAINKTRRNYQIISVEFKNGVMERNLLTKRLSENLNWTVVQSDHDPIMFATRGFWNSGYEIFMIVCNNAIHFDIQHFSSGITDLGAKNRIIKRLKLELGQPTT